jgi:hypothetical protein
MFGLLDFKGRRERRYQEAAREFVVPYSPISDIESRRLMRKVREAIPEQNSQRELVWKKTIPAAQERVKLLDAMGYSVSKPRIFCYDDAYMYDEERSEITIKDKHKPFVVGAISYWREGGFTFEPLRVNIDRPEYEDDPDVHMEDYNVEESIKFRKTLISKGIPFCDPLVDIQKRLEDYREEIRENNEKVFRIEKFLIKVDRA